jgi:catechol 2,3-dioxygenase-like lactoylglutathione lyase family enzyme
MAARDASAAPDYWSAMSLRITVVTLGVSDLDRAQRFYVEGLGFRASSTSNEHIVFLDAGGVMLALYGRDALADDAQVGREGSGFRAFTLAHNVGSKREVNAMLAKAKANGGTILKPAQDVFWGGYSGYFADPDGVAWEVAFNPHWKLDANGGVIFPA